MLQKFQNHIQQSFSFLKDKKFYIAVSGGIDSMVLVHLFQHFQFEFGLLHCNFKLRGEESDADMRFIQDYAEANSLQLKIGFFETAQIAKESKISIQVAARELRYQWFYQQMKENNVDFVATAHHLDDKLETFFINLSRGTGLDGLTGIPTINDKVFRPLLPFSREEIENYANENNLKWREDSSNASDKYLRNKIRHHLVPVLKDNNEDFLNSFQKTQTYLKEAQALVNDAANLIYQEVAEELENGTVIFDIKKLIKRSNYGAYLYQWLHKFGFSAWNDVYNLVNAQSGKQVFSESHILLKDRNFLLLSKQVEQQSETIEIHSLKDKLNFPLKFDLCNLSDISNQSKNVIFVDENKIQFPLTVRKWKEGDYFYPSGMQGKKKVSKYFKDEKFTLFQKQDTWILESNKQIVWILGYRADERFVSDNNSKKIIKITYHNEKNI
ncbi:tRNA lysidine(34) synthetase TilS [Flavobacterium difficile]|uniref:tRNA(Ile)-lysidine synthase n=1 Tax=Flavobacterium difficile TaxID=2709659 RepID=A0ABX0I601_9FLAO|nr:tRNA lysidine(34) synthetase TilS [Flavobacterium difficile]NHM02586.1 tRNA lysidine(34) synthetase TilS [Flavobacterium difficile]